MITKEMIKAISPNSKDTIVVPMVKHLNVYLPQYGVNNYLRIVHFLAQAAHESAGFRTLEEYADGSAYEGRKNLGNTQPGDGKRYKGRGIFQLTGRANYRDMSVKLGRDLENNPILAKDPEVSVLTALEYWKSRGLNTFADQDNLITITKRINGGLNGLDSRKIFLARAKNAVPKDIQFVDTPPPAPEPPPVPEEDLPPPPRNPIWPPIVVAKLGDNSPYIGDLQQMLVDKGWKLATDGNFGPKTEQAVREFQAKRGLVVTGQIDTDTLNSMMV